MSRRKVILCIAISVILLGAITVSILLSQPDKVAFYNVTFQDFDGTVLKTESVAAGKAATPPEDPQREGYTFAGWNKEFSSVVKDTIVTAEYIRITETAFMVDTVTVSSDIKKAEIKVSVTNNPGILGMSVSLEYDENALKLVDCQTGLALSALTFQKPSKYNSGCNFVWYGSETGEVMDDEILILTFEIIDGAKPGNYPITISWNDRDIYDSNCDMVDPDITQGAIVVS